MRNKTHKISIDRRTESGDLRWAGDGWVNSKTGEVECSADIAESVYDAIEAAILDGIEEGSVTEYTWSIEAITTCSFCGAPCDFEPNDDGSVTCGACALRA
jgi:hypothetical protein